MGFFSGLKRFANHNLNPNNLLDSKAKKFNSVMNPNTIAKLGVSLPLAVLAAPAVAGGAKAGIGKIGGMFKGGGVANSLGLGDMGTSTATGVGDSLGLGEMGKAAGGSRFRSIGKFLGGKDGFGMDDLLDIGSAAGDAYGAYRSGKAQDKYAQMAEQEWQRRAPLRDAGMKMLMDDSTPDTSAVFDAPAPRYRRVRVGSV